MHAYGESFRNTVTFRGILFRFAAICETPRDVPTMGAVKREWMETRKGMLDDKYVCEECVEDEFLNQEVRSAVQATQCSCRDRSSDEDIAAPVRVVQDISGETFSNFFADFTAKNFGSCVWPT
jgi:hypothetical protein